MFPVKQPKMYDEVRKFYSSGLNEEDSERAVVIPGLSGGLILSLKGCC